jgi:hypothetical protein
MQDKTKFFAGVMSAMSCMLSLGVSMVCIMSKMDLVKDSKGNIKREVGRYVSMLNMARGRLMDRYLDPDPELILEDVNEKTNPKYHALNRAVAGLVSRPRPKSADRQIEDQNIVSFLPLDVQVEDSVNTILSHIDNMMQYGEDEEPKMPKDMDEGEWFWDIIKADADYQVISIPTSDLDCQLRPPESIPVSCCTTMHPIPETSNI